MATPTPTPTSMPPPFQQWQNFYPAPPTTVLNSYEREHSDILNAMASQHQHINQNIYQGNDKLMAGISASSQYLTGGLNNIGKDVTQSALGLRDSVERGNLMNGNAIERTAGEIKLNAAIGDAATRQANADAFRDVLRSVDANGALHNTNMERIGLTVGNSVERTAGEIKLNTAIGDAATRQASADAFRDVLRSVDSNGALHNTNMERIGLTVGNAVERNAGEIKLNSAIGDAASRQANADAFRDVLRAVDSNGALHNASMERIGMTLGNSVERTAGQAINTTERTGGNIMTAIEKVAGEGRMTTTVADAASRQAANDTARDIMSGVERNGANNHSAIQSTGSTLLSTMERVAGEGRLTTAVTDAASRQANSDNFRDVLGSVDRTGAASVNTTQAIGSTLLSTMERVAGEGRVTTTVTDAASRQAAADSARDVMSAVERNGGQNSSLIQNTAGTIGTAIERTAGDVRTSLMSATANTNNLVSDVRHAVLNDVNRGTGEMLMSNTQNLNVITKAVSDSAWETRVGMGANLMEQLKATNSNQQLFSQQYATTLLEAHKTAGLASLENNVHHASLLMEQQKMKDYLSSRSSDQFAINQLEQQKAFAINQLEQQKSKEYLSSKSDNHFAINQLEQQKAFAINQLEQQKAKEYLSSKGDNHFAINQLEQHKIKESLAAQAAQNYASLMMEQQKAKECLSAQLAEAKYDALKNTQFLADKMGDCCCEVKEKIDLVDRDRLRDHLIHERDDNSLYRAVEYLDRRGRGRGSRGSRRSRSRSGSRERRSGSRDRR